MPGGAASNRGPIVITGGAGFIGTNIARRLLDLGERVVLYDNLSRTGVERNADWIRNYSPNARLSVHDIRDRESLQQTVSGCSFVFHFAAQVAVTSSLRDPLEDFEINVRGTLNLLEALRRLPAPPPLLYTSTNKVFGALDRLELKQRGLRYEPADCAIAARGVGADHPLAFFSPYGCSKGAADQYVLDYARHFGLQAVVFRMSCIYGPHQCGNEDQGWVAHFLLSTLRGDPLVLYGDGMQVRDLLYVDDLVEAMLCARARIGDVAGKAFTIGGGPSNSLSLLELLKLIRTVHGAEPDVSFSQWRPGDQKYYVADTSAFNSVTGWTPKVDVADGVGRLYHWLLSNMQKQKEPIEVCHA